MNAIDIEMACVRLLEPRANFILPNVSWSMFQHECDLLVISKNKIAREIEIKTNKYDLKKDREKKHNHCSKKIQYLYYAVPENLQNYALSIIYDYAGLIVVTEREIGDFRYEAKYVRKAKKRNNNYVWHEYNLFRLAHLAMMRYWNLRKKLYMD